MLKTVSAITNALGALNYKGTWNASTNTPALASGVGTKGDYYVVSVAGSTALDGISNWGVGDWVAFNGSAWQRVEGGADLNGVNLSVSGTSTLSALTASTALALNASKEVVSVTNTGSGNNVLGTSPTIATPTLTGNVQMTTGNLVVGTAGKGIDFSADPHAPGMTSELLDGYEEGTWTPSIGIDSGSVTYSAQNGTYTKIGNVVTLNFWIAINTVSLPSGTLRVTGLPFAAAGTRYRPSPSLRTYDMTGITGVIGGYADLNESQIRINTYNNGTSSVTNGSSLANGCEIGGTFVYIV
jgi:hypothetical protein